MKKITTLFLAFIMLVGLCACGGGASTPSPSAAATDSGTEETSTPAPEKPILRVGMECGYAPYNWAQSDDGNGAVPIHDSNNFAYGYDVMMAKYLADQMGYDVEIYQIEWLTLPVALMAGDIDCVIAGQSVTAERLETVDFTTPYYYASIVGLTLDTSAYATATGLSELEGAVCTSQLNTVWYNICLPQIKDADILPAMETAPTMLVALSSGKCDLVVTDEPTALAACAAYPNMVVLNFADSDDNFQVSEEEINIGISVKKGNSEMLDALNAGLATLTTDDFTTMMNEAIAVQPLSN